MAISVFDGALYPFRGLGFIARRPRLWRYIAIPIGLNLVVGAVLYIGLLQTGMAQLNALIPADLPLGGLVAGLANLLVGLLLLVAIGFVLVRFGVILGAPFYGRLSELIEEEVRGSVPQHPLTVSSVLRDIGRALLFELKKLALIIPTVILLLLFGFIPFLGQAINLGGGLFLGAVIACLDFFDGALERRRLRFRQKLAVVRQHAPASLGFGLVAAFIAAVPLLNLFALPLCVAGGTLFLCEVALDSLEAPL